MTVSGKSSDKSKSPTSAGSVFDRLYKTNTLSSRTKKDEQQRKAVAVARNSENKAPKPRPSGKRITREMMRKKAPVVKRSDDTPIYNRLYSAGTASSRQKRNTTQEVDDDAVVQHREPMKPLNTAK